VGRRTRAFCAALALHALAAALLDLVPPATVAAPRSRTIELEWTLPLHAPAPPRAAAEPVRHSAEPVRHSADEPVRHSAEPVRHSADEIAPRPPVTPNRLAALMRPPGATTSTAEPVAEPTRAAPETSTHGPAQLFPRGLLEKLAAPPDHKPARDRDRDTPGGWLDDAAAEARTRAGQVAPVWREVERDLLQNFRPPVDVVHDTPTGKVARVLDRFNTYLKQQLEVIKGGEDRLRHPVDPDSHGLRFSSAASSDPSQQGFTGVSEGLNLRSTPLSQQEAVMAATGDPASWLVVEIEITVDGAGSVTQTRVVMPSGRRAFDRYALRLIAERVAHATPPASISRWVCRAGYAASRLDAIGLNFDLSMLSNKQLRKQLSLQYPLKERVETRVSLKWVKNTP
jgi:hypothetical protein